MKHEILENKYSRLYFEFIQDRKHQKFSTDDYTETHHIIPRSLGGTDDADNLIKLYPRDHFFAHLLLSKMFAGIGAIKMAYALKCMRDFTIGNKRYTVKSREYALIKSINKKIFQKIGQEFSDEKTLQNELLKKHTNIKNVLEKGRGVCQNCGILPKAYNYKKDGKIYYRNVCDRCSRSKSTTSIPKWMMQGYKKSGTCDCCGYKAEFKEQLLVHELNQSFKTICLNCQMAANLGKKLKFKSILPADIFLKPDF